MLYFKYADVFRPNERQTSDKIYFVVQFTTIQENNFLKPQYVLYCVEMFVGNAVPNNWNNWPHPELNTV